MGFPGSIKRAAVAMMVPGVQMAFVDDLQTLRRKSFAQLLFGDSGPVHVQFSHVRGFPTRPKQVRAFDSELKNFDARTINPISIDA